MKGRSSRFEPVRGTFAKVLSDLGLAGQLEQYQAVARWGEIVGQQIARHTRAHAIEKGEMLVLVDSHVWVRELTFLKPEIINKLNSALGQELVTDIRFALMHHRPDSEREPS